MKWIITPTKDRRFDTAVPCWIIHPEDDETNLQGTTCWSEEHAILVSKALNAAPQLLAAGQALMEASVGLIGLDLSEETATLLDAVQETWIETADPYWTCPADKDGEIVTPQTCHLDFVEGSEQCLYCCNHGSCSEDAS